MSQVAGHRTLWVVVGPAETARAEVTAAGWHQGALWIGAAPPDGARALSPSQCLSGLGTDEARVILDLHAGLDADVLAVASGLVRGGGQWILLVPGPLDPAEPGAADAPHALRTPFGGRLRSALVRGAHRIVEAAPGHLLPPMETIGAADATGPWVPGPADELGCVTPEQRTVVDAVVRAALGHRRRPVVVQADRGRGKSAALGLAVQALFAQGAVNAVRLITPTRASARAVEAHAGPAVSILHWCLPQDALTASDPVDLVVVDEAATMPVGHLLTLLERHPRIVFSTTVHGYEGTGRGFDHAFLPALASRARGWVHLQPETPVRWAPGDPVEAWVRELLLSDARLPPSTGCPSPIRPERFNAQTLLDDPACFQAVFALLVEAHYRTRPSDLQRLLDDEALAIWMVPGPGGRHDPVAAAVVTREGGWDAAHAEAIWAGERRPRGQMLAQSLAVHGGVADAASLRIARIQRIAVRTECRRRGVGEALVRAIRAEADAAGLDAVGASFGGDAGRIDFWRACGLLPVRLGTRVDRVTGEPAVQVLDGLSASGRAVLQLLRRRLHAGAAARVAAAHVRVDPALLRAVYADGDGGGLDVNPLWSADLMGFACRQRDFDASRPALHALALAQLGRPWAPGGPSPGTCALVQAALQGAPWDDVARTLGVQGRRGAVAALRRHVQQALPGADLHGY